MKLSGLNNLTFAERPKAAPKSLSEKADSKSSFEDVLGQNAETAPQEVQSEGLPAQPSAPSLSAPINERMLNAPVNADPAFKLSLVNDKVVAGGQDEGGVDSLTRRVVWNDFLRKMKDDLGVSADDVLKAFASLSEEELAAPPLKTVDSVVAALGLNDQQSQLAKVYFNELVSKTKSGSMSEEIGKSQRQINLTLMSQREALRKTLSKSLEQMNQNFFMKDAPKASPEASPEASLAAVPQQTLLRPETSAPVVKTPMVEVAAPSPQNKLPEMGIAAPTKNFDTAAIQNTEVPVAKPTDKNTLDEMIRQFYAPQSKIQTLKAGEMAAAPAGPPAQQLKMDSPVVPAVGMNSTGSLKGLLEDLSMSSGDSTEDDKDFTSDASFLTPGMKLDAGNTNVNGPRPEFQAELNKAAERPMGVSDLVDKAQIMVHEGGGEMKVTLTPDGLGEVAMKVSVNEGKVQVHMITESDEAKRLIERQLGDLKSQLHSNQLQVDTIKIDTATNLGKQLEQQYQDAQRQATQTAWEQFRQDNQGWRRSFFEVPSARLYKGQGDALRDVEAPSNLSSRKNVNRRLDLVA